MTARALRSRFAGPLEIYPPPWWWRDIPYQRQRGPAYRLTPQQIRKLVSDIEYWLTRDDDNTEYLIEEAHSRDLIEVIRQGRCLTPFDGEMPQPESQDSYNSFARKNPHMCLSLAELNERAASPYERSAAKQQATWEATQRARQIAREANAQRAWDAETGHRATWTFWANLSSQFVDQPLVRIRTGNHVTVLRDDTEPWRVRFEPDRNYSVPDTVADILVRTAGAKNEISPEQIDNQHQIR